jgi:hypothetical protein
MKKRLIRVAESNEIKVSNVKFEFSADWIDFTAKDVPSAYFSSETGKELLKKQLKTIGKERFNSDNAFKNSVRKEYFYVNKDAKEEDATDENLLNDLNEYIDFVVDNNNYSVN